MSNTTVRTILPLSIVTCTSMLAMDLFLPAVPVLQAALGIGVSLAQATVAVFLAGLAASQLLWAEALHRWGPRRTVQAGVCLLVAAGLGCALAPGIEVLLAMRLLQGIAAGAATVVAPSVVRATLSDADAVRGIATIAMIESAIPAAGPVLGAALLTVTDWRGTFWVLAVLTLLVLPFVVRVTPRELPGLDRSVDARYSSILRNHRYLRLTLSHALSFGALLTFVASGPQLVVNALALPASAFAALQVIGVSGFMVVASQAGRLSASLGAPRIVQLGAWLQAGLCGLLLLAGLVTRLPFAAVAVFWFCFCASLAVRGPAAFSEALTLPPAQMGRASAMMVLALLLAGALGTQSVAPFMGGTSVVPLAAGMLALCLASLALVLRYPQAPQQPA
ncbi:MFS transporter [Eleftheria terrae]|uniref:MFS transporter n=1 Tax=Eleftheria terrae TaxID=1597781 RepID=UPI00263AC14F|nr:MFS transporter [Eleftheria terrae]WKB51484.1 MFS transporter [Eleftheria terrae]